MRPGKNTATVALGENPLWYNDAVIYELHVRASSSTTDRIGSTSRFAASSIF
jgi:pullulanase/glycogen debranching enzyme